MNYNFFDKFHAVIFDLDNTIYPELSYLERAYKFIANNIAIKNNKDENFAKRVCDYLYETFINYGRENLYQKLTEKFSFSCYNLQDFLHDLHNVPVKENEISIYSNIQDVIEYLIMKKKRLIVLTNGNVIQQNNKFRALNILGKEKIEICYASSLGITFQKPDPFFIHKILSKNNILYNEAIFIGDSLTDLQTAKNAGIMFMNVNKLLSDLNK